MKPEFMLINWTKGEVVGCGDEAEVRDQLDRISRSSSDTYLITKVEVLSTMQRVES